MSTESADPQAALGLLANIFDCDAVMVADTDDPDKIASSLDIPRGLTEKIRKGLNNNDRLGTAFDFKDESLLVEIGFVRPLVNLWVILMKSYLSSPEMDIMRPYSITTDFLDEVCRYAKRHELKVGVKDYRKTNPEDQGSYLEVCGCINEVIDNKVQFSYMDDQQQMVLASASLEIFKHFSDLTKGTEFRIQTWEEGNQAKVQFVPLDIVDPNELTMHRRRVLKRIKHYTEGTPIIKEGQLREPNNWSDRAEVHKHIQELKKKYDKINYGKDVQQ